MKFLILLLVFPIYTLHAQDINSLVPDASISEADAVEIKLIITKIETPSMDVEITPEPPLLDFNAPNYLELVYYRMTTALVQRADRENYYGDIDEKAGYPRRFGPKKPRDYYVNIFKAQWESERPTSSGEALRAIKVVEPACPSGFEIYEGSGICNQFPSHVSAEQNYYHCSLNNFQLWQEVSRLQSELLKKNIDNFADGAHKGNLWKPIADPKASCSGGTTVLLDQKHDAPAISLQILDPNLQDLKEFIRRFPNLDDGRPRFCVSKAGAKFGTGPIYIKFADKIFRVNNPSARED